ncbi:MAG: ferritin-like domain-containing protein [Ilumatobacteraceae bacterium]
MEVTHAAPAASMGRRRLLGAGLGLGAATSLLPMMTGTAAATAATTPPKAPTADDIDLLAAAQRLELSLRDVYDDAIANVAGWSDTQATVMVAIREAHEEFANALSATLGRKAPNSRSEIAYATLHLDTDVDPATAAAALAAVESAAVATHQQVLGGLTGTDAAALTAAIITAEARHCTVLADLAGITDPSLRLVDAESDPVDATE